MRKPWGRWLQFAAACGLVVLYAAAAHYCNVSGAQGWGAAVALTPPCTLGLILAWRETAPLTASLLTALAAGGLYFFWPRLTLHFSLLNLLQESSVYALLASTFARSLRPDRVALCTQIADRVHGPLSTQEVHYTRTLTAVWALFFGLIVALSLALYCLTPLKVWSIYSNFCVLPAVAVMFIAENLLRRRVLPSGAKSGFWATMRIFKATAR